MASKVWVSAATEKEMLQLAKAGPADNEKIRLFATGYLGIEENQLEHLKHEAGYRSIETNFKCLRAWCNNQSGPNAREKLYEKLTQASKEGLINTAAIQILNNHQRNSLSNANFMKLAERIPTRYADHFAWDFLKIQQETLSKIKKETNSDSIMTMFKCLQHWYMREDVGDEKSGQEKLIDILDNAVRNNLLEINAAQEISSMSDEITRPGMNLFLLKGNH